MKATKEQRFRKRSAKAGRPKAQFSTVLGAARDSLHAGRREEAMQALDGLAAATHSPRQKGKIAALLGEDQFNSGKHEEAAQTFSRAAAYGRQAQDYTLVLRAGIGLIRAELRLFRPAAAQQAANGLLADLDAANQAVARLEQLSPAELLKEGVVEVPARPPRLSVALTKAAQAFIEGGDSGTARLLLDKVIAEAPNGGARARQLLARLALAGDDLPLAERHARESLMMGRFQAKTIAAWELYLGARGRQGAKPLLEPLVWQAFQANAKGGVLARATLLAIRSMRAYGDDGWVAIADQYLTQRRGLDGVIATEIEKILNAEAKLTAAEPPSQLAARSLWLFRAQDSSPNEQVAHAKAYTRFALAAGETPKFELIASQARKRFGDEQVGKVAHAMALGAMLAKRHDLARNLLNERLGASPPGSAQWGQDLWALARMEEVTGNLAEASFWFFDFAKTEAVPVRFRIQAMLRGFHLLSKQPEAVDTPELSATIRGLLDRTDDFKLVLDAARQLRLVGNSFTELTLYAAQRGGTLADKALARAGTPAAKLAVLEYAARKFHFDLRYHADVTVRWEMLGPADKAAMSVATGSLWYEYLALVFRSYDALGRRESADRVAAAVLDGDTATPEGYVIVGVEHALARLARGDAKGAMEAFAWISTECPTHRRAAPAHYWLALAAWQRGDATDAAGRGGALRRCFAGKSCLLDEWLLDAAGLLLMHQLEVEAALQAASTSNYTEKFLTGTLAGINRDLTKL